MKKIVYALLATVIIFIAGYYMVTKDYKSVPVLMYHHFDNDKKNVNDMTVQTSEFEKQIKYLKDNGYTAITLKDLTEYKENKKSLPEKPILITIDDGYRSNYDIMYPIIKKYKMKATIFVIGERIDNANKKSNSIPKFNWKQAKEMYDSNIIDIECHTYDSHKKGPTKRGEKGIFASALKNETKEEFESRITKDLEKNMNVIKKNIGYTPIALAYPYGDYSSKTEKILKNHGIKYSFLAEGGKEKNIGKSYLIKRIPVDGNYTLNEFKNKLK